MADALNLNPQVPSLPKFDDKTKIDVRYMVIAPYVSIHVHYDQKLGEVIYEVEEPLLSEDNKKNLKRIEAAMKEIVNINRESRRQTTNPKV